MIYSFRPARRTEAKPLIGLFAESGAGKTLSALLLARGFAGEGIVAMIETESGRGEAYADDPRVPGSYLVLSIRDDCSPTAFGLAIAEAEKIGASALIIDSASLEWTDGPHSVTAKAAELEKAGAKGMLVWKDPKMEHQREFIVPLLRTPIPLVILCMRARYAMAQDPVSKEWKRDEWLTPYQSDTILFELYAHGWIDRAHKFHGTKYTRDELATVLVDGEMITLETGRRMAEWAKENAGGAPAGLPVEPNQRLPLPSMPPGMTPLDDWKALWRTVTTQADWDELNRQMTQPQTWSRFKAPEQKELLTARDAAKKRIANGA